MRRPILLARVHQNHVTTSFSPPRAKSSSSQVARGPFVERSFQSGLTKDRTLDRGVKVTSIRRTFWPSGQLLRSWRAQDDDPVQGHAGLSDGLVGHGRSAALACFFKALSVAEIDLANRTLHESDRRRDELLRGQYQQVDRLRHAPHLAERQYRHSEPENRLVTAELKCCWETRYVNLKPPKKPLRSNSSRVNAGPF